MKRDLFADLVRHVRGSPDRKGEAWITCPNCGKGDRHFSFSAKGAHCFACGWSPPMAELAERLGLRDQRPTVPPAPQPKRAVEPKPARWLPQADELAERFAAAPGAIQAWTDYKPIPAASIRAYGLGLGIFPDLWYQRAGRWLRCDHPRLIVPLRAGGVITGFRCRAIGCDCPKWISPSGTRLALFNGARLLGRAAGDRARLLGDAPLPAPPQASAAGPACGPVLAIVENIADALLVEARWDYPAVATHGVTIWRDEWTQACAAAGLEMIVVAYDHDLPGGGPANPREHRAMLADWARRHPRGQPPTPGGVRLANRLLAAGLQATRFPWPEAAPLGFDIGNLLIQETSYA